MLTVLCTQCPPSYTWHRYWYGFYCESITRQSLFYRSVLAYKVNSPANKYWSLPNISEYWLMCENFRIIKCIMCIMLVIFTQLLFALGLEYRPINDAGSMFFSEHRRVYETRICQNREDYEAKHILSKIEKHLYRILCTILTSSWNRQNAPSET
jgi:hypothetical protein